MDLIGQVGYPTTLPKVRYLGHLEGYLRLLIRRVSGDAGPKICASAASDLFMPSESLKDLQVERLCHLPAAGEGSGWT